MLRLRPAILKRAVKMREEPENPRRSAGIGGSSVRSAAVGQPTGCCEKAECSAKAEQDAAEYGKQALGQLVRSKAGHDKGALLVIVGIADEAHVLVADGKLRRLEKPKKKKLRHLEVTALRSEALSAKLIGNCPIQDAELRRFIASCREEGAESADPGEAK